MCRDAGIGGLHEKGSNYLAVYKLICIDIPGTCLIYDSDLHLVIQWARWGEV